MHLIQTRDSNSLPLTGLPNGIKGFIYKPIEKYEQCNRFNTLYLSFIDLLSNLQNKAVKTD